MKANSSCRAGDGGPQQHEPDEGRKVELEVEEDERPAEVHKQLHRVKRERALDAAGVFFGAVHEIGRDAHEDVLQRPRGRERPRRAAQEEVCSAPRNP